MIEVPRATNASMLARIFRSTPEQLRLPLEVPGATRHRLMQHARDFATGFAPKLGATMLMRVGVPMVAATTPVVIRMLDPEREDGVVANLLVGSALGGAWGAAVGALIPRTADGIRVSRIRSAGSGAAAGVVLAPAVALASKYVADWLTAPLEGARERAEDRARDAEAELDEHRGSPAAGQAATSK